MTPPLLDLSLLEAARRGDRRALNRLTEEWLGVVYGWCLRLGGPHVDAEDAAHEALLIMLARLPSLQRLESFPSWIFSITRKTLASHRRRAFVRRWIPGLSFDSPDPSPSPARRVEMSQTAVLVQGILASLPEAQREVLVLCDVEERTDLEVAGLLDLPVGTVKSRLRLARARFRTLAGSRSLSATLDDAALSSERM